MAIDRPNLLAPHSEPTDQQLEGVMHDLIESVRRKRAEAVHQSAASARMEGWEPTPETRAIMGHFVAGRIDDDEMMRRILAQSAPDRG